MAASKCDFIRPPFSVAGSQFSRKTAATNWTPWPFGAEGAFDGNVAIVETASAADAQDAAIIYAVAISETLGTGIVDSFTDTNGTALATHDPKWTAAGGLSIMAEIQSNTCRPNGDWAVSAQYYNNGQPADQESQVVFLASTALRMTRRACVRMSATVLGYGIHLTGTGSNYTTAELEKNGSWFATLTTGGSWPYNADHTVQITVSGSSPAAISAYIDGSQVGSTQNDSSSPYTTGYPGLYQEGDGTRENAFDDWTDNYSVGAGATDTTDAAISSGGAEITEAASATDTENSAALYSAAVAESGSATDTPSAASTLLSSIAEAASATDTPSAIAILLSSITEAAAAVDTKDAVATRIASIVEAATADDSESVTALFAALISETASASDAPDSTALRPASATESGSAIDIPTSVAAFLAEIHESANATDECSFLSLGVIRLYNGVILTYNATPTGGDIRLKAGATVIGIPVITATDDHAGAIRIKANGTVRALQQVA